MFAYRNKETGKWLVYNERTTHTGTKEYIAWVDDIDLCYVGLLGGYKYKWLHEIADQVRVIVERKVIIEE